MKSGILKIKAGRYRVVAAWGGAVVGESIELLHRRSQAETWSRIHLFTESGQMHEFEAAAGETCLKYSHADIGRRMVVNIQTLKARAGVSPSVELEQHTVQ